MFIGTKRESAAMAKNELYYGDNLDVLRRKIASDSVDLCYIDPPFNSKRNYFQIYNNQGSEDAAQAQAFVDTWEWGDEAAEGLAYILDIERLSPKVGETRWTEQTVALLRGLEQVLGRGSLLAYLVHMSLRIVEIQRVLKPTGSFYLHCDPTASHYLKLVCDAVFCGQGGDFKNEIVWERTNSHNMKTAGWIRSNDVLLYYTKSSAALFNTQYTDYGPEQLKRYKPDASGRLYKAENMTFSTANPSRNFEWRGTRPPPHRSWGASLEQLEQWWEEGRILTRQDGSPRMDGLKIYLDETKGKPVGTNWNDIGRIGNTASERMGYPTQKPEALMERIIKASSNEGDTVLDAYCGCGTTVAVAQRLGRRWIGIDVTYQSISLILKRLEDKYGADWPAIEANLLLDGVPRDIASATALANRKDDKTRKEFEKWAVLTYTRNQGRINEKKGGDGGVDGIAFFLKDKGENGKAIFSVKSDKTVNPAYVDQLAGTVGREGAEFGFLLCLTRPSDGVFKRAASYGKYKNPLLNREDDRIQVITAEDILAGRRLDLPMARTDAVKTAKAVGDADKQATLL